MASGSASTLPVEQQLPAQGLLMSLHVLSMTANNLDTNPCCQLQDFEVRDVQILNRDQ